MTLLDAKQSNPSSGGPSFSLGNRIFRVTWSAVWFVTSRWTPPFMFRWRRFILRLFGANIHPSSRVYGTAKIWNPRLLKMAKNSCIGPNVNFYNMGGVEMAEGALVSQGAYICGGTHDFNRRDFQLVVKPIYLGAYCWIAAEAFIGPGVKVGNYSIIGARCVLTKNSMENGIYAGNPARKIGERKQRDE